MIQSLTKPQEGETAAESIQIARRRRAGDEASLFLGRLAAPAARTAGEWWVARRLPHIVDVGVKAPKYSIDFAC